LNPRDLAVIDLFIPAAHAAGKDGLAKGILDNLSMMHPDDLHLQELRGKLLIHTGDFAEAEKILLDLHSQHGRDAAPLLELLEHYADKRKTINFTSLAEALAENLSVPDDLRKMGELVQRVAGRMPDQSSLTEILARLHARRGDFDAAAAAQAELMSRYALKGDLKKAFLAADQLVQWSPENSEYLQQHRSLFEKAYPGKVYEPPAVQPVVSSDESSFDIGEISPEELEQIQMAGVDDIGSDTDLDEKGKASSKEEGSFEISLDDLSTEGLEKGWDTLLDENEKPAAGKGKGKGSAPTGRKAAKSGVETGDFEIPTDDLEKDWDKFLSEATGDQEIETAGDSELTAEPEEISSEKVHEIAQHVPLATSPAGLSETLQEVDFYLKMGFQGDARLLLDKLSSEHPESEEVKQRLQELEGSTVFKDEASARAITELAPAPDQELKDLTLQIDEAINALFDFDASGLQPALEALEYKEGQPDAAKPPADEFQTHMDLGKAYREMGLIPDAIQEFHKAIELARNGKGNRETPLCYSLLANCYLESGESDKAAQWAQRGLQLKGSKDYERKTLLYDLGRALEAQGKNNEARELFRKIQKVSPNFRDISDRLKG
jgi:tetratricopeptide (TPR) repeat protein